MGLFTSLWIWVLIVQHGFEQKRPDYLDWTSPGFGRAFGIYIMLQTSGNMVQNYLYFLIGTIGDGTLELSRTTGLLRGVESWGQCASFGISSRYVQSLAIFCVTKLTMSQQILPVLHHRHQRCVLDSESDSCGRDCLEGRRQGHVRQLRNRASPFW
jgi:hypothetical protein